jgi:fructokinase
MVATDPEHVIEEKRFPTCRPEETVQQANLFFAPYARRGDLAAVGIAAFGPLDLNPLSPTYGYITGTPKPDWSYVDLHGRVARALELPTAIDTDVNAAAFGEHYWTSRNNHLDPFVYVTVGTGIGMGVLANGRPLHGLVHTEAGHFVIPHDRQKDPFQGLCPYHGDCLEGLASGPAIQRRWGKNAQDLPDDHPAWDLEAEYIALALMNVIYAYSPERIILGGGVSQHTGLHAAVRLKVQKGLNGYVQTPTLLDGMDDYIVPPSLGNRSGVLGAIAMAIDLAKA